MFTWSLARPSANLPSLSVSFLESRITNFVALLSSLFATLTNSRVLNPFICHSYENNRGGTLFFPFWERLRSASHSALLCYNRGFIFTEENR